MKTIDWRGEYLNNNSVNVAGTAQYMSISGRNSGIGSRNDPFPAIKSMTIATLEMIIGNGNFNLSYSSQQSPPKLIGHSMQGSILNLTYNANVGGSTGFTSSYYNNLTLKTVNVTTSAGNIFYAKNCILDNLIVNSPNVTYVNGLTGGSITNCIHIGRSYVANITSNTIYAYQCTFKNITSGTSIYYTMRSGQALIIDTIIPVNQSMLTNNYTYYTAFNNCSFAIGAETEATPLVGNNADELRANFVSRCLAQGLTVPTVNEYGGVVSVGRWIFSKTSIAGEYDTLHDSEIDKFAKLRGIYFGHTNKTINQIPITTTLNIPASFNTQTPVKDALVSQNSIGLLASSDITDRIEAYADSKIIWLGGLQKLTTLSLTHNLPTGAGVAPDSVYGLAKVATTSGSIIAGNHYIIRSTDSNISSIKYNNVEYTSSLITRNNVFLGVAGVTTFDIVSGNPQIFQVLDFANHQSLQIRLMREIPTPQITSGNLQAGYWYFVEPNNLSDTSGTITYKGIARPAFDSFLVDAANLTFTVNGNCHLRRCWKQDFDYTTESTDKSFWTDRQKPYYFDIVSDDLRCLLKYDSSASVELKTGDDGVYIGSGHPEFYNSINGVNGLKLPAYDIVGSFLQIRVPITTINPM